jgi:hypothetical protein
MKNIKYINKNMDFNNILKMITPEMIGAIAPLLIPSETPTKKTFQTPSEPTINDDTPTESPKTTEKQDDLEIFDDMLRKILPILLKTVFKIDPTLETLVRDTLKEIDQENSKPSPLLNKTEKSFNEKIACPDYLKNILEEDIITRLFDKSDSSVKLDCAEKISNYLCEKATKDLDKDNTLITDFFKSKGSVFPPKQSEEEITFLKYYSEDKEGNLIPDELLNVYAFCRSKPNTYVDVDSNEWDHIFSLKSMMYASINTDDEEAIIYLSSILEFRLTKKELLDFYSYLERLSKPCSPVQEIITGLYFKILGTYQD